MKRVFVRSLFFRNGPCVGLTEAVLLCLRVVVWIAYTDSKSMSPAESTTILALSHSCTHTGPTAAVWSIFRSPHVSQSPHALKSAIN